MGIDYFEEDSLNGVTPFEQSDADIAVVTTADRPRHAEEMKVWTACS